MKRSDAAQKIQQAIIRLTNTNISFQDATAFLDGLEEMGMVPPHVDQETTQALISVCIYPLFYQWDEDIEKDAKVMEAKRARAEWAAERAQKAASKKEQK
jgi:hypothetical protein